MKRFLAGMLVFLQIALSFSFNAYEALAQSVQSPVQAPMQTAGNPVPGIPVPLTLPQSSIIPLRLLGDVSIPVSANQSLSKFKVRPALPAMAATPVNINPMASGLSKNAVKAESVTSRMRQMVETFAKTKEDASESSRDKEEAFSDLLPKLIDGRPASSRDEDIVTVQQEAFGALNGSGVQEKSGLQNSGQAEADKILAKSVVPVPVSRQVPHSGFWQRPAVRRTAGIAALAAASTAIALSFPWLLVHFKVIETIGNGILAVSAIPQIMHNARMAREDRGRFKELNIKSPLIWFAAAVYLTVSAVHNNLGLWIAANVAGVVESSIIIAQINHYKKDAKDLRATFWTAAAVLLPLPFIAAQVLLPISVWMKLVNWTWMGLLTILSLPQIRQNAMLYKTRGKAPKAVDPINQALVFSGSAMQLFSAIIQKVASYATNAILAMVSTGTVLGQIFFPKATNTVILPIVQLEEKVHSAVSSHVARFFAKASGTRKLSGIDPLRDPRASSHSIALQPTGLDPVLFEQAKDVIGAVFRGSNPLRFAGRDKETRLQDILDKTSALPGRSLVYLEAPTAAGKSTLAKKIESVLGSRMKTFPIDRYFKPAGFVPKSLDGEPDFDRPESLDLDLVAKHLQALLQGKPVELPYHDMQKETTEYRTGEYLSLGENDVLIVDSTYALHDKLLRAAGNRRMLKVFLTAPASVRLARRLKRDIVERNIPAEMNLRRWQTILYDEKEFILPMQDKADVVLNLVGEDELKSLPDAYAVILAREWAEHGKSDEVTRLFVDAVRASLQADQAYKP